MSDWLHYQRFVIVGLGISNLSVMEFLNTNIKHNAQVYLFDTRDTLKNLSSVQSLMQKGEPYLSYHLSLVDMPIDAYLPNTVWIIAPGISLDNPYIAKALSLAANPKADILIHNDISIFALVNQVPLALVTGTNGKSTVTTLLGHLLNCAGLKTGIGGNIGIPALALLSQSFDCCVLEVSSFQLEIANAISAVVATCLNVTPDHLDRHKTMQHYQFVKHQVFNKVQCAVVNKDDSTTVPNISLHRPHQCIKYTLSEPGAGEWGISEQEPGLCFAYKNENGQLVLSIPIKGYNMVGLHNRTNALAALAMAHVMGAPLEKLALGLYTYKGLEHRCQWVSDCFGAQWINDSKGTNVDASILAIKGTLELVSGNVYLIAGGESKGADLSEMAKIVTPRMPLVVLLGKDAARFEKIYHGLTRTVVVKNMEEAVKMLAEVVKPGDAVLLSPACASIDMYDNFEHRGRHFTELVKGLNCASDSSAP